MNVDLDLAYLSAADAAALVSRGEVSPVELLENALARIEAVQPQLNCFSAIWADEARAEAKLAADALAGPGAGAGERAGAGAGAGAGGRGALHGVPIAVKETTHVHGRPLTLGSFTHQHVIADRDAYITRALRAAGAIIVGATTSPEFAHTLQTDSPMWGPTRNPWQRDLSPGGSSGGSGAAVASGCVYLAEGSDMGGSVRIPAAWSGTVGLKAGIGRIPMDVLPGLFDTISHHGPLARTVDDARTFLAATQGPDDADIQSVTTPLDLSGPTPADVRGMRIALSLDYGGTWYVHPEIRAAVSAAAESLAEAGAVIEPIDADGVLYRESDEDAWIKLWGVFMSAYFGHLLEEFEDRMDPDVVGLIALGNSLSATEYKQIELVRTDVWRRISRALAGRDALLCPTMAMPPVVAAKADRPRVRPPDDGRFHADDMTSVWNMVPQCPVISVPCGIHDAAPYTGVPIGMQIAGHRWREDVVLRIARAFEVARPEFVGRRPPV